MQIDDVPLHALIRQAVRQRPEAPLDVSLDLWERLAIELVAIIGEGGFLSLYARSVHLAGATYPWLQRAQPPVEIKASFASLKESLEAREAAEIEEASIALFIVFTDILATLIGTLLTANILRSAWGDAPSDSASKETQK